MKNTLLQKKNDVIIQTPHPQKDGEEEPSLIPSIKKETITIIKGVGPKVAEKLNSIGIHTIVDLSQTPPEYIAKLPGIGLATAEKYVLNAKEHMKIKKLNNFSEKKIAEVNLSHKKNSIKVIESDEREYDIEKYSRFLTENEKEYTEYGEITHQDIKLEKDDDLTLAEDFEDEGIEVEMENEISKTKIFEASQSFNQNESPRTVPQVLPIVISPEIIRQSNLADQEKDSLSHEIISRNQIQDGIKQLTKNLHLSEFSIIERLSELRIVFTGIDLLAIKHVHVQEFVDLIYILPIKICALNGSLVVSNGSIKYIPSGKTKTSTSRVDFMPQSYLKALSQVQTSLYSDMLNKGAIIRYLSKYLGVPITLEKSFKNKNLYFRSGPLLHKILIEPILVSFNSVGFTEKMVPFAYQQSSNTHIIALSQFVDLLQYLDQKYFLLETYKEEKNAMELNCKATNKFMKDLRKYSAPFMFYGLLVLIILLSQAFSVLPLLVNLGYGVISMYIVMVGYLYLKLYKEKAELHQEFSTPYYQKKLNLEDGTLFLINEEISPRLMDQFTFECVREDSRSVFINKREQENAEKYLTERVQQKRIKESNIFESDISPDTKLFKPPSHLHPPKKDGNSALDDEYIDKYSSFLED